jgi:hypothetical protein
MICTFLCKFALLLMWFVSPTVVEGLVSQVALLEVVEPLRGEAWWKTLGSPQV